MNKTASLFTSRWVLFGVIVLGIFLIFLATAETNESPINDSSPSDSGAAINLSIPESNVTIVSNLSGISNSSDISNETSIVANESSPSDNSTVEVPQNDSLSLIREKIITGQPVHWIAKLANINDNSSLVGFSSAFNISINAGLGAASIDNSSYTVDYYTPAPTIEENFTPDGKIVTVSAADDVHYTDVIARVPVELSVSDSKISDIHVLWFNHGENVELKNVSQVAAEEEVNSATLSVSHSTSENYSLDEVPFEAVDSNNDGLIDYIQWVVPHLSAQSYQIVFGNLGIGGITNGSVSFLPISSTAPWNSLVGYWNFDADSSTTAFDLSGNGYNGAYTGNAVKNSSGVYGSALSLDGTSGYVLLPTSAVADEAANFTQSAWVYYNGGSGTGVIEPLIYKQITGYFFMARWRSNRLFQVASGDVAWLFNGPVMNDKQWYHVAITRTGTNLTLYVNGAPYNSSTVSGSSYASLTSAKIGSVLGVHFMNGLIDEVMIFNSSLTPSQIKDIYNNQSMRFVSSGTVYSPPIHMGVENTVVNISLRGYQRLFGSNFSASVGQWDPSLGLNTSNLTNLRGLVAFWSFDNISSMGENSTLVVDRMTGAYNATISTGVTYNSSGKFGGAFSFSGAGLSNISSNANIPITGAQSRTITEWFYYDSLSESCAPAIFSTGSPGSSNMFLVLIGTASEFGGASNNGLVWSAYSNEIYGHSGTLTPRAWNFMAATYDGTYVNVYINGNTVPDIHGSKPGLNTLSNKITLGRDTESGCSGRPFVGKIDEVMIFNRALAPEEIDEVYAGGRVWNYSLPYQNLSANTADTQASLLFPILTRTTHIRPSFQLTAGANQFYSPILYSDTSTGGSSQAILPENFGKSTCGVLDTPNSVYNLSSAITASSTGPCFNVTGSNIVLEGLGQTISGTSTYPSIYIYNANNITVKNVISSVATGIGVKVLNSTFVTLQNVTAKGGTYGILLDSSQNVVFSKINMSLNIWGLNVSGNSIQQYNHTIGTDTYVNGKQIYYNLSLYNYKYNAATAPNAAAIYCIGCNNIEVNSLTFSTANFDTLNFANSSNILVNGTIANAGYVSLNAPLPTSNITVEDSTITGYYLNGVSKFSIASSGKATIAFNTSVTGASASLASDVLINTNNATIISTSPLYGYPVNIVLYNVPTGFSSPALLNKGYTCRASRCKVYDNVALGGTIHFFAVKGGAYSVGEAAGAIPFTNCMTLDQPTEYILGGAINDATSPACLIVTSDDVIITGQGNAITGSYGAGSVGIYASGVSNLEIDNLGVTGFGDGIVLSSVNGAILNGVSSNGNVAGGYLDSNSHGAYITGSSNIMLSSGSLSSNNGYISSCTGSSYNGFGAYVTGSSNVSFISSTISGNYGSDDSCSGVGGASGYGIYATNSPGIQIIGSAISGNYAGAQYGSWNNVGNGYGIYIQSSPNSVFTGNTISSNNGGNSDLSSCSESGGSGYGIYSGSSDNITIADSTITGNNGGNQAGTCTQYDGGSGYGLYGSTERNVVIRNITATDNVGGYSAGGNGGSGYGLYGNTLVNISIMGIASTGNNGGYSAALGYGYNGGIGNGLGFVSSANITMINISSVSNYGGAGANSYDSSWCGYGSAGGSGGDAYAITTTDTPGVVIFNSTLGPNFGGAGGNGGYDYCWSQWGNQGVSGTVYSMQTFGSSNTSLIGVSYVDYPNANYPSSLYFYIYVTPGAKDQLGRSLARVNMTLRDSSNKLLATGNTSVDGLLGTTLVMVNKNEGGGLYEYIPLTMTASLAGFYSNSTSYSGTSDWIASLIVPKILPRIAVYNFTPNDQNSLDPNVTVLFFATANYSVYPQDTVILQYYNGSIWTNLTLSNLSNQDYNGSIKLQPAETNYSFTIWANDSLGYWSNTSKQSFSSFWDCTWNLSSEKLPTVKGYYEDKYIENFTIANTGDSSYAQDHCNISYRLNYNGFSSAYFVEPEWPSSLRGLQIPNAATIPAKTNYTVMISASFPSTDIPIEEAPIIRILASINDSLSRKTNMSVNMSLVVAAPGPYILQKIVNVPQTVYLTPSNFSIISSLQNVAGDGTANNTAYNASLDWILPSFLSSAISEGNESLPIDNLSTTDIVQNQLNFRLDENSLPLMSQGTYAISTVSEGYSNVTGSFALILNSQNKTLLNNTANITFVCYSSPDGIYVPACGSLDGDYVAPKGDSGVNGGGGGGGGGGGTSLRSEATFELVRGKDNSFTLPFKNTNPDPLVNISVKVSGLKADYLSVIPVFINALQPGESTNVSVKITAPTYFTQGSYNLTFIFSGQTVSKDLYSSFTETKIATLVILEFGKAEATAYMEFIRNSTKSLNESGMDTRVIAPLLDSAETAYANGDYSSLKSLYEQVGVIYQNALSAKALISELKANIADAKNQGITTTETEKILYLAQTAFNRGDYSLAVERLKEAKLTYALEVKGEFNLMYAIKNNPLQAAGLFLGALVLTTGSTLVVRLRLYKKKLALLREEEKLLLELMKVIQRECFEKKTMSMEEYDSAMKQYEIRLSETIEDEIRTQTRITNMFKIKGKRIALQEERGRLTDLIKTLQDDYLNKGKIETRVYENMLRSYAGRLTEVEEQMTFIDAEDAIKNKGYLGKILKRGVFLSR